MRASRLTLLAIITCLIWQSCVDEDHFGKSSEKKLLAFALQGQTGNAIILEDEKRIELTVGAAEDLTKLKPIEVALSTFATLSPGPEVIRDFSAPVSYTVTAEDGSQTAYLVVVEQELTIICFIIIFLL